ncbi:hypothetical protein JCM5350_007073 [Sporobolomyces pararoseus]
MTSLSSFPPEVIFEIASYLKGISDENVEAAKAISLVCRRWRSIGQATRWNQVSISPHSIPSLSKHFDCHPQFRRLVRTLVIKHPTLPESDPFVEREHETLAHFPPLLSSLSQITHLDIFILRDENLLPIVRVASNLPMLKDFCLHVSFSPTWTNELDLIFRKGFKNLNKLVFLSLGRFIRSPNSVQETDGGGGGFTIPVDDLCWSGASYDEQDSTPHDPILAMIDRKTLRTAKILFPRFSIQKTLVYLSTYPFLTELNLQFIQNIFVEQFPQLLSVFPKFSALQKLTIMSHNPLNRGGVESPVALRSLLASLPSSLKFCGTRSIQFPDAELIPGRQIPFPVPSDQCFFVVQQETDRKIDSKMFWRDDSGRGVDWFRTIPH